MHPVLEFSLKHYFVILNFVTTGNGVTGERFGVCVTHNFSNLAIKIKFLENFLPACAAWFRAEKMLATDFITNGSIFSVIRND